MTGQQLGLFDAPAPKPMWPTCVVCGVSDMGDKVHVTNRTVCGPVHTGDCHREAYAQGDR